MANCPNCNAPLEDDARFCPNCGAVVVPEEAAPYVPGDPAPAPEAPPPAPEAPPPAFEAPSPIPETPSPAFEAPSPAFEAPSPAFDPVPASETAFCPNCGEMVPGGTDYCEHCGAPLNADGGQPQKKTGGSGLKKWMILGGAAVVVVALVIVLISVFSGGGGKGYGLYLKDGEMYYSNLSKNGVWQFSSRLYEDADNYALASSSSSISSKTIMSKDGKTLFFPDRFSSGSGFTLYYRGTASEKKEAVKIDSGITRYSVNDGASLVTYLKSNGNLYQYTMSRDDKEKLAGGVYTFYVSDDGKKIIFIDDEDTLYQLDSGKDKEKLDSGVNNIAAISDDCKTMIYRKGGDTLYLKQDGKDKVKISSDVSDVQAYKTGEAYYTEEDDDEITLYYFDGKDSKEVTDEFRSSTAFSSETPVMVYVDVDRDYWLAAGEKTSRLDAEEPYGFTFSKDGKSVWYVDEPYRNEGELYLVTISNGTAKKAEKQDEDVYVGYIWYSNDGHLIYFKDVDDYEGELYVDGKKADDDVYIYTVRESESGILLYYADYNFNKGYGTLKQYSGGKPVNVADDVSSAYYLPNGNILYLADYNSGKSRGDLYVYKGNKSEQLDEDVAAIVPVSTTRKYGS